MDFDLEFPSKKSSIQFNHAAICPLPARAAAALLAYARKLTKRGGRLRRNDPARLRLARRVSHGLPRARRRARGVLPVTRHRGPEGCGILFTTPELRVRLAPPPGWTNLRRAHGADSHVPGEPEYLMGGSRFEPGALSTPGLFALAASLALLLEIGFPEVERRIAKTLDVLVEGLPRLGFAPVPFGGPPRSGILAARPPAGKDARYFQKCLADENVVIGAREGFVRFSPHVGNDEAEAERVLALLKRL